jgi:arylsulfatase A
VKLLTGRDNIRIYVGFGGIDKNETTFGTRPKNARYATAVAGKWQLSAGKNGSFAPDCGFGAYCLWH